ncbi:MAG: hypothetical protein IJQ28_04020 [Clostridia bacterium]|nr:hypothetical protein [Clostridia bacterium]
MDNEQQDSIDNPGESKRPSYPSAHVLLQCAWDEYTKERERSQFLDSKASFFMSAVVLVATVFVPMIPFEGIRNVLMGTLSWLSIAVTVLTIFLITSFIILALAFKALYDGYNIRSYKRFNPDNLFKRDLMGLPEDCVSGSIAIDYGKTIKKNAKRNNNKSKRIKKGIRLSAVGFLLLALSTMLLKVII